MATNLLVPQHVPCLFLPRTFAHATPMTGETFPLVLPMVDPGHSGFRSGVPSSERPSFPITTHPKERPITLFDFLHGPLHHLALILFIDVLIFLSVSIHNCNNTRRETLWVLFMAKFPTLRMELSAEHGHNQYLLIRKPEGRTDAADVVPAPVGKMRKAQEIQCHMLL